MTTLQTATDFELFETIVYAEELLREHSEMDCRGGGEFECATCDGALASIKRVEAEQARRAAAGIEIPDERVGLAALDAYGYEWQVEQLDRAGQL